MAKFKVGDKVKVIKRAHFGAFDYGHVGAVSKINSSGAVQLNSHPQGWFYGKGSGGYLELINNYPNPPHKHADVIKAWADGAEIEFRVTGRSWGFAATPTWCLDKQYRIKPSPTPQEEEKQAILKEMEALKARLSKLEVV